MTESSKFTPETITEDDEKEMIEAWKEKLAERKDELISFEEMQQLLRGVRHEDHLRDGTDMKIPGGFNFGTDERLFYTVLKYSWDEEKAQKTLGHELEHAAVYKKHGIPFSFNVVVSILENGENFIEPYVAPEFPADMPAEERIRISRESLAAVTNMSMSDAERSERIKE